MLVSSIFIDDDGKVWFGYSAVIMSQHQTDSSNRQRLDNIKRYLTEEGVNDEVSSMFNPTDIKITYEDMLLSYLACFSWAITASISKLGFRNNILRRFAMPCLDRAKKIKIEHKLRLLLAQSQVLADSFAERFNSGIYLSELISVIGELRKTKISVDFIGDSVTEPLGVAGSLISWEDNVNSLVMVIDIGAGTSDCSLYRIKYNEQTKESAAFEVNGASRGITEAGNHLDKLLQALIIKKAGVGFSSPLYKNVIIALNINLREYKEYLFKDGL